MGWHDKMAVGFLLKSELRDNSRFNLNGANTTKWPQELQAFFYNESDKRS